MTSPSTTSGIEGGSGKSSSGGGSSVNSSPSTNTRTIGTHSAPLPTLAIHPAPSFISNRRGLSPTGSAYNILSRTHHHSSATSSPSTSPPPSVTFPSPSISSLSSSAHGLSLPEETKKTIMEEVHGTACYLQINQAGARSMVFLIEDTKDRDRWVAALMALPVLMAKQEWPLLRE